MKETEDNKKDEKDKLKDKKDTGFLILLGILAALFIVLASLFVTFTDEKNLEEKCLEYQNDPALAYTCRCVPTVRPPDETDVVDLKTDGLCTCYCDIGNNQTAAIEVRVAKK